MSESISRPSPTHAHSRPHTLTPTHTCSVTPTHTLYADSEMTCLIQNHCIKEGTIFLRFIFSEKVGFVLNFLPYTKDVFRKHVL